MCAGYRQMRGNGLSSQSSSAGAGSGSVIREALGQQTFDFKPEWWTRYVNDDRWPATLSELPEASKRPGYRTICRSDVFALAQDQSAFSNTRLLLAAYAWGTGPSAFLVGRRVRCFTRTPPETLEQRLTDARVALN